MDENAPGRADDPVSASRSIALNIRGYLDDHRTSSPRATSVVMQVVAGSAGREGIESASGGSADPAARLAIDRLRRRRAPKTS